MTTHGDIRFYQRTKNNQSLSDFKKTRLRNGHIRWSYMQQTNDKIDDYFLGTLVILDDKFRSLKEVNLLPYNSHPALPIENHESIILDDNHLILATYYNQEILDPHTQQPVRVVTPIIQEQKNNQVLMEWNAAEHLELINNSLHTQLTQNKWTDFFHLNSILIDPTDDNLLISSKELSSVIKIHRKTGKTLWILGGKGDEFHLTPDQFFIGQHALSWTKTGNLMLFDNNITTTFNIHKKPFPATIFGASRILQFQLDQQNKKLLGFKAITLPYKSFSMANVYETSFGFVIGYGAYRPVAMQLLDTKGASLLTLHLLDDMNSYKAYYLSNP